MTLLFVDGFDHYATADIAKKWNSVGVTATIRTGGRDGGGSFGSSIAAATTQATKTLAANASWVIGFRLKISAAPAVATSLIRLLDAGTVQCSLILNTDLTLSVVRSNSTALTNGTSATAISANAFFYIEWKVTIANSIGASSCSVRLNGVQILNVATSQDTQQTANASANQIQIGTSATTGQAFDFDDLYVCNQSGSTNNDFLGDCRVDAIYPTADGAYSAFTPSTGTTHYNLVDETTPNGTDYVDGASAGDRDSYAFGNLSALTSQTIYGVQVNAAVLKDDAGAKSMATFARSGTTNSDGANTPLGTSQVYVSQIYEQDPDAAAAWTEATVNAAEFGVLVGA